MSEAESSAAPLLQAHLESPLNDLYDAMPVADVSFAGGDIFHQVPSLPAPPPPPARAPQSPSPGRERAAKKELSPRKWNFWTELLEKIERLSQLSGQARTELLAELIDSVGAFYRKLPASSRATAIAESVVSLLVDLEKAQGRPEEEAAVLSVLRSLAEAAQQLPE